MKQKQKTAHLQYTKSSTILTSVVSTKLVLDNPGLHHSKALSTKINKRKYPPNKETETVFFFSLSIKIFHCNCFKKIICMFVHTSNQTNSTPTVVYTIVAWTIDLLQPETISAEPIHSFCGPVLQGMPQFSLHFTKRTVLHLKYLGCKKALKDLKTNLPLKMM